MRTRLYNGSYAGEHLNYVGMPLGGIGAGMLCFEGTGALGSVSLRNAPALDFSPLLFSALCIKGRTPVARVLEGPVPPCRWASQPSGAVRGRADGLPRFRQAVFHARFPFATVTLRDPALPLTVHVTGWSPFIPGDADNSSLPVAALEYRFKNRSSKRVDAVYSFHAEHFMKFGTADDNRYTAVRRIPHGFALWHAGSAEAPWQQGSFSASVIGQKPSVNCAWFRGSWFDALTMVWKDIAAGAAPERPPLTDGLPSPGGSLSVAFSLKPGQEIVIPVALAWHVPFTQLSNLQKDCNGQACGWGMARATYQPWYAGRFADMHAVNTYWSACYAALRAQSQKFSNCFYRTTLAPEVVEAVAANLTILKSPTVLRLPDGRLWAWEGSNTKNGCCHGSCTHVWNYAQALPHLFPDLERSLRQTEFQENQDGHGHQNFRADLPVHPLAVHTWLSAADGQLGGIMKVYREWRISGDTAWLRALWPRVQQSMQYCIDTWDPDHAGVLQEPHHNTYDIEFWGPDGMHMTFYLGALRAAGEMARALGDAATTYDALLSKGRAYLERALFNGRYFVQKIMWQGLRAGNPVAAPSLMTSYSAEAHALLRQEGPKYQYGDGCLADGVLGAWLAAMCGVPDFMDANKLRRHLRAVHQHNLKRTLVTHVNPQRPHFALGDEGGLLLCTWPKGQSLSLPFPYSDEVWTGIEYQVAAHLILLGCVKEGLEIVRVCRDRYDGRRRNPFDEIECGHWYARAMSSYGLLHALSGIRYDAIEKILYIAPRIKGDFKCFIATAGGYGLAGVRRGKPFLEVHHGVIDAQRMQYTPCAASAAR